LDSPGAPPPASADDILEHSAGSQSVVETEMRSFEVQNVTGMFSRSEQLCLGVKGISTWSIVFQRDDEQRILDCSRLLDVQRATPDENHFTIKFGPRVKLETFLCEDMNACVEALHKAHTHICAQPSNPITLQSSQILKSSNSQTKL